MNTIGKEIFLSTLECPTKGWMLLHGNEVPEPSTSEKFRMRQGKEIGRKARLLFPNGFFINDALMADALNRTQVLMGMPETEILFEATARYRSFIAKSDIVIRQNGGWHIVEVKSGVNDKDDYTRDLAYTVMVFTNSGYSITKASLMLLSKDYRLGFPDEKLFVTIDKTLEALSLSEEFSANSSYVEAKINEEFQPKPQLQFVCNKCELFSPLCLGKGVSDPIFLLPRLSQSKFDQLQKLGVTRLSEIPGDFELTNNQQRVYETTNRAEFWVGSGLVGALEEINPPVYYLDFETTMTAIPLYPGISPYSQIPTQYSLHIFDTLGRELDHREYLANPKHDCRRELAENLILDLGSKGSILVYSSFEKTVINNLSKLFLDLAPDLRNIVVRLVDLAAIIRKNYYHPGFLGSISIKKTLPVLVPESSYEHLSIQDGDTASILFAEMAQGLYSEDECSRIRRDLLAYCRQDTQGMVDLHRALVSIANKN